MWFSDNCGSSGNCFEYKLRCGEAEEGDRLNGSRRTDSSARIRERVGASGTSGWPVNVRDIRLQRKTSSRLRRQMLKRIELKLSPQPSFTPPCPTPLPNLRTALVRNDRGGGRTCGAVRMVEVEPEFETPTRRPPKAGTHLFVADGRREHFQASQRRSKRPRLFYSNRRPCSVR